jgi:hypothetical protein
MSELFEKVDLKAELAKAETEAPAREEAAQAGSQEAPEKTPAAPERTESPDGADGGDEPEGGGQKQVPLRALQAEREKQKRLQQELEARIKKEALLEERLRQIEEAARQQKEPEPEPIPDYQADPAGHLRYLQERTGKSVEELRAHILQRERAQEHATRTQQIQDTLKADEAAFLEEAPDFHKAAEFLTQQRDKELLEEWGITDPDKRLAQIKQDFTAHVQACLQLGQSSARRLYSMAKQRGYKSDAQPIQEAANAGEKIAMLEKGQGAARSLSGAGGKAPVRLTLESIASMSDDEFRTATAGKNWAKLFSKA